MRADFALDRLRPIVEQTLAHLPPGREGVWLGSNHDHPRMATRWACGDERKHRAALFLLLTLPGVAILYQGDEIALADGEVPRQDAVDLVAYTRDLIRRPAWARPRLRDARCSRRGLGVRARRQDLRPQHERPAADVRREPARSVGGDDHLTVAAVVTALVSDLITPLIAAIGGKPNFANLAYRSTR